MNLKSFYNISRIYFLSFLFLFTYVSAASSQTDSNLIIGEFKVTKVVDGDTFRFDKLDGSARLQFLDTEETFKDDNAAQKTDELRKNWDKYYKNLRDTSKYPVKADSPFGYDSWQWAKEFMKDVDYVRLEKDDLVREKDIFNRWLAYMIVIKNGKEINYNIEAVRQGISPYFNKYGNSKRFHNEFVAAQNYAKENKLGIWSDTVQKYPDYDERLTWWDFRAKQLEDFDSEHKENKYYFNISEINEYKRLENYLGQEVIIFGSIGELLQNRFPYLMTIPVTKENRFEIVIFEEHAGILNEINLQDVLENYVYIMGKLEKRKDRYQIILRDKNQIWMDKD